MLSYALQARLEWERLRNSRYTQTYVDKRHVSKDHPKLGRPHRNGHICGCDLGLGHAAAKHAHYGKFRRKSRTNRNYTRGQASSDVAAENYIGEKTGHIPHI